MKQTCCHHVTGIRCPSCHHVRDEWELHGVKKSGSQSDFTTDWASRGKRFLAHSQNEEKSYIHHHLPKKDFPQNAVCFCNLLLTPTSLGALCIRVIVVLSAGKLRFFQRSLYKWPKFWGGIKQCNCMVSLRDFSCFLCEEFGLVSYYRTYCSQCFVMYNHPYWHMNLMTWIKHVIKHVIM